MAGARRSKSRIEYSDVDRNVNSDTSATARLLPSDDQPNRDASLDDGDGLLHSEPPDYPDKERNPADEDSSNPLTHDSEQNTPRLPWNWNWNWKWILCIAGGVLFAVVILAWLFRPQVQVSNHTPRPGQSSSGQSVSAFSHPRNTFTFSNGTQFVKPPGLKIIGIVFYGRREFVNVLECYLRRNLRVNGGLLDEVHFLMHTDVKSDVKWIKKFVKKGNLKKHYKLKTEDHSGDWRKWGTFGDLYKNFMTDPDAIYVKVDDDVLFIDDYAIPELIRATLEHPEAHSIQANVINNKWNRWHHLRSNAIWPYLADADPDAQWSESSWRPSKLPRYKGHMPPKEYEFINGYSPPNHGHRWLPLKPTYKNIAHTPYGHDHRNPMVKTVDLTGWALAAQSHYSFFENLERGELTRYSYGNSLDNTWNQWYTRYNINLMAIRGSYVSKNPVWEKSHAKISKGDEYLLTQVIPKELDMPVLVATRAIAAHYSFRDSRSKVLQTDILDRYRALANELYCEADNRKFPLGKYVNPHHIQEDSSASHSGGQDADEEEEIGDGPQDLFNANNRDDDDDGDGNP